MNDITRILSAIELGDPQAAGQLLPLVYDELRKLAARRIAREAPGITLQATALVHEAYLRLVAPGPDVPWNSRGHFFAAAAEAMRRILVDEARRKRAGKRSSGRRRVDLDRVDAVADAPPDDLFDLDEALEDLGRRDPEAGQLVKLRVFAGLSVEEAAEVLGLSRASAYRQWTFARAWLRCRLANEGQDADR